MGPRTRSGRGDLNRTACGPQMPCDRNTQGRDAQRDAGPRLPSHSDRDEARRGGTLHPTRTATDRHRIPPRHRGDASVDAVLAGESLKGAQRRARGCAHGAPRHPSRAHGRAAPERLSGSTSATLCPSLSKAVAISPARLARPWEESLPSPPTRPCVGLGEGLECGGLVSDRRRESSANYNE